MFDSGPKLESELVKLSMRHMSMAMLCFTTSCQSPGKDTLEVRVMGLGMVVVVLHNFYNPESWWSFDSFFRRLTIFHFVEFPYLLIFRGTSFC